MTPPATGGVTPPVTQPATPPTTTAQPTAAIEWRSIGPYFGKVQSITVDPNNPKVLYISAGDMTPISSAGIYKSTDSGATWNAAVNGLVDRNGVTSWTVNDILTGSASGVVVAATSLGIFRSTDGAASWTSVASKASQGLSRANGKFWAVVPDGVMVSADDGATWTQSLTTTTPTMMSISAAGDSVYAGSRSIGAMFAYREGSGWAGPFSGINADAVATRADPADPRIVYVATGIGTYVSQDSARTWKAITPQVNDLTTGKPTTFQMWSIAFSATKPHMLYGVAGGTGFTTSDLGQTWARMATHGDNRGLLIVNNGHGGDFCYMPGDQGLFALDRCGDPDVAAAYPSATAADYQTYIPPNLTINKLPMAMVNFMGVVPGTSPTVAIYMQDCCGYVTYNDGATWANAPQTPSIAGFPSEIGAIFIHPANPDYCYGISGFYYGMGVSKNGCKSFTPALFEIQNPQFINPGQMGFDIKNPGVLYMASGSIPPGMRPEFPSGLAAGFYKSTDWGTTVKRLNWPLSNPLAITVDPTDSKHLFAQTMDTSVKPVLYVSRDQGANWKQIVAPDVWNQACVHDFHPVDRSRLILACNGISGTSLAVMIYQISGASDTITRIGQITGTTGAQRLVFNPTSASPLLALATVDRLALSADSGATWTRIDQNAGSRMYSGVAWSRGVLYAATRGRGVIRTQKALQ